MITNIPNEEIVSQLPLAEKIYKKKAVHNIENIMWAVGKVTFDDVRLVADAHTPKGTALNEALVRIIECENVITLEVK